MIAPQQVVLFGAAAVGRFFARKMVAAGLPPVAFIDNDLAKQNTMIENVPVLSPEAAWSHHPDALWLITVINPEYVTEITEQITHFGVQTMPLAEYLPELRAGKSSKIPPAALHTLLTIAGDDETRAELIDQEVFRRNPDISKQRPMGDPNECYFPEWIKHLDGEHYADVGAADGDTIQMFLRRWKKWEHITAIEPDASNFVKLRESCQGQQNIGLWKNAVSDYNGMALYADSGDCSAHIEEGLHPELPAIQVFMLDDMTPASCSFTYIKMDIEGAELKALWGARNLIREHSPVLAICAYHEPDHLWQIPLLIHALNPTYKLFLRRYMQGCWELIWYAVPPDRIVQP